MPRKSDIPPNITSLDLLKSLYSELSAPFIPYFKTILRLAWRDDSPDIEKIVIHDENGVPKSKLERGNYRGAKSVIEDRAFIEETCGSLYAPVSALGYRSFDYSWALAFKIDCDTARQKTGSIEDAMVHYISDVAADDKIIKRRMLLKVPSSAGRPSKTNTEDIEERYLKKMKNLTFKERKEISAFLKKNKKELNDSQGFRHEDYKSRTEACSVSISAGPDDLDDESFLSWLVEQVGDNYKSSKKRTLDQLDDGLPRAER